MEIETELSSRVVYHEQTNPLSQGNRFIHDAGMSLVDLLTIFRLQTQAGRLIAWVDDDTLMLLRGERNRKNTLPGQRCPFSARRSFAIAASIIALIFTLQLVTLHWVACRQLS